MRKNKLIDRLKSKVAAFYRKPHVEQPETTENTQSQPTLIYIENKSDEDVQDVDIFGAFKYLTDKRFDNGDLVIGNITISGSIDSTYSEVLWHSATSPFRVGLTYIQSIIGSHSQVTTPFIIEAKQANGNSTRKKIYPSIDPYQQQTNIVAVAREFNIDGDTKIIFQTITAKTKICVQVYPSVRMELSEGLPLGTKYSNPNVIKGVPVFSTETHTVKQKLHIRLLEATISLLSIFRKK